MQWLRGVLALRPAVRLRCDTRGTGLRGWEAWGLCPQGWASGKGRVALPGSGCSGNPLPSRGGCAWGEGPRVERDHVGRGTPEGSREVRGSGGVRARRRRRAARGAEESVCWIQA